MNAAKKDPPNTNYGYCNICNISQKLTWDHVPPKGSVNLKPVEIRNFTRFLIEKYGGTNKSKHNNDHLREFIPKARISQNGIKFKSICANCNNRLLGRLYDPEIKKVSQTVGRLATARISKGVYFPKSLKVRVKTHSLVRGLIGHMLAAHVSLNQSQPLGGFDKGFYYELRKCFLDSSLPIPANVKIYYWTYLSETQVIIPGLDVSSMDGAFVIGDLLKFFPLAYFIVNETSRSLGLRVPSIHGAGCTNPDCEIDLHVQLDNSPPLEWPELPTREHFTMMPLSSSVIT